MRIAVIGPSGSGKTWLSAQLAERLGVTASPTVVFLEGGKEKGERLSGEDIKRTELKARVEAMLGVAAAPAAAPAAT